MTTTSTYPPAPSRTPTCTGTKSREVSAANAATRSLHRQSSATGAERLRTRAVSRRTYRILHWALAGLRTTSIPTLWEPLTDPGMEAFQAAKMPPAPRLCPAGRPPDWPPFRPAPRPAVPSRASGRETGSGRCPTGGSSSPQTNTLTARNSKAEYATT